MERIRPAQGFRLSPIFASLDQGVWESLAGVARLHRYRAGAYIFIQGDPADEVLCIEQGQVSIFSTFPDGRTQQLAFLGPGDVFGELGILGEMPRSATAESLTDCSIWGLSGATFSSLVTHHPAFARAWLKTLARQVVALDSVAKDLVFLGLRARVAKRLLELVESSPADQAVGGIPLPWELSQTQLASYCGATRENVSRVLSDFRRRGFIEREGRQYILLNLIALRRLAQSS